MISKHAKFSIDSQKFGIHEKMRKWVVEKNTIKNFMTKSNCKTTTSLQWIWESKNLIKYEKLNWMLMDFHRNTTIAYYSYILR